MSGRLAVIEARGLEKAYGGVRALRDLDLRLAEGETLGVIGPNGAGKTTLFNLLSGSERADSGRIFLRGVDVTRSGPERRARLGLARTFQAGRCFANLSVEDNVLVGAHADRMASRARIASGLVELAEALVPAGAFRREEEGLRHRARALVASYGERLAPRLGDKAYSLSYANRRRLEIARALAARPKVLLLDEPTAGMNPSETDEMIAYLESLKAGGLSMIVIEHKLSLVVRLADRALVLDEGAAIAEGAPEEVSRSERVIEAYLGRPRAPSSDAAEPARSAPAPLVPGAEGPSAALLELDSVDSYYGQVQVHRGLCLEVREGEIVCLLGGNASGKSTAMKVALGLLSPRSGEVLWKGSRITSLPTPERIKLGLAFVPEARRVFPEMSVGENILMGAFARGGSREARAAARRERERVLELFPRLADRLGQIAGSLSGGEQQMLAIARALMSSPSLLCMDEPTMGLSPLYAERVLEAIRELNRGGVSIFMVEQNAHQALGIAHRGYVLQNGRIVLKGPASELLVDPRIRDAYLGGRPMSGV
jgi:ABC-type branched-subunit amino acid transport system ATPase component